MQLTVVKVQMYVDGGSVTAVKDRDGRIHFNWSGTVDSGARGEAQRRLIVMLRNFDISPAPQERQLPLPIQGPM